MRFFPATSAWKRSESAFDRVKIFLSLSIWKHWPSTFLPPTGKSFLAMRIASNYSPEAQLPLGVTSSTALFEFLASLETKSSMNETYLAFLKPRNLLGLSMGPTWMPLGFERAYSPLALPNPQSVPPSSGPRCHPGPAGSSKCRKPLWHLHVPPARLGESPNPTVMQQQTALDGHACRRGLPSFSKIWLAPWDHRQVHKTTHETTKQVPHLPKWFCGFIFPDPLNRSSVCSE